MMAERVVGMLGVPSSGRMLPSLAWLAQKLLKVPSLVAGNPDGSGSLRIGSPDSGEVSLHPLRIIPPRPPALPLVTFVALLALVAVLLLASGQAATPVERVEPPRDGPDVVELRRRAEQADSLGWLHANVGDHSWLASVESRTALVREKHARRAASDPAGAARAAGVLAAEAQVRAALVLDRWAGRLDRETGLLPKGVSPADRVWDYADAGADLYPHLTIAAALLRPELAPAFGHVIASERALAGGRKLPADVDLANGRPQKDDLEDRIYGAVEYAKDGLLPLTERLGSGPWLARMEELARLVDESAPVRTRFGAIPSEESEVNGQTLQVLVRLYWATGEDRYRAAAERIARAYLELALPSTDFVPARTWDFRRERPNTDRAQLRDHGNEVVAGLVEYHLIESVLGGPDVERHRAGVRTMLDRLLQVGRTPAGLWKSAIDLESGQKLKHTLSDNWGYLYAAYLTQALIEERLPGGDPGVARRYREASEAGLAATAQLELYPWQGVEQDGYADTIESGLYLINALPPSTAAADAAAWVDRQAGTLFGAQEANGRVEDRYLDGNFVRTAMLYAAWQSAGTRLNPWRPDAMVGAVPDGACVYLAIAAAQPWNGRLVFDAPRHHTHLNLPFNYPRLNAWPEWFTADAGRRYGVEEAGRGAVEYDGAELLTGLPIQVSGGEERQLRVCPAA